MRSWNDVNGSCANRRSRLTTAVAGHEKRSWASSSTAPFRNAGIYLQRVGVCVLALQTLYVPYVPNVTSIGICVFALPCAFCLACVPNVTCIVVVYTIQDSGCYLAASAIFMHVCSKNSATP
jgi:hypothetical protein